MRKYPYEETIGTPVSVKSAKDRRGLIGKQIEWNTPGWVSKRSGVVEECGGKNILVSGNWEWAPDMLNVKVSDDLPLVG